MIILGIDPGTATTGFGVIKVENGDARLLDYGCIETSKNEQLAKRLNQIGKDLEEIIEMWHPDNIAIEELFFSKNVKTALHVAHARGAIMQKLSDHGYEINEYKPQQIKEAVSGYGKAEKKQVQKMVQLILKMNELPKPDDAADALATAICHAQHMKMAHLTRP
ncbi:crossover junction endodeoxyribonuclease RuvC [Patescibacteria group bacterium]|nr:crossover junction endodeoxyribonuclease RuvC [Patescibacteria group bacterium]MBU1703541.1 crossover junction endodeoxyribonuclease RuvC [Patescibacteria group bacterium]MBU1953883.1 crossover junction endodeoxyribonuclease RuvC [Patescibacteria group bacterium]